MATVPIPEQLQVAALICTMGARISCRAPANGIPPPPCTVAVLLGAAPASGFIDAF